jgi:hypothetical protein
MTYTYTIIKRLLSSGRVFTALWVFSRVLIGKLLGGNYRYVYALERSNFTNIGSDQLYDYEIDRFNSWSELNESNKKELEFQGVDLKGIQKLFIEGGHLLIGRLHSKITNFGWSRFGNKVAQSMAALKFHLFGIEPK